MTPLQQLNNRIEAGIAEQLIPTLLERLFVLHRKGKNRWRSCQCPYCSLKRQATSHLAFVRNNERPAMRADFRQRLKSLE